ncbi:MAG TPA: serine/threonine-protein kinase [Pyrinomonadaceae bacterium]|jgi:serine/threonine protein kinase
MTGLERYVGQVLDEKYRLERLLGQGGMGAVYLATHLGTERFVALKLITPQFMRNAEFVERFKREARAAGRLRHPNVVDVTDFGFARAGTERVAYLVMEYLDGCTLGDVLAEEVRLPLEWVVDILEQVCSAVHEAHQQGIVHRDLKPDNIWLEPNRLGGYRVKVLDFGIAKLAEAGTTASESTAPSAIAPPVQVAAATSAPGAERGPEKISRAPRPAVTDLAADTLLQPASQNDNSSGRPSQPDAARVAAPPASLAGAAAAATPESGETDGTLLFPAQTAPAPARVTHDAAADADGTRLLDQATQPAPDLPATVSAAATAAAAGLTRVGAIMGTPLYMSPEQCRGEQLDARADIYSLGVIAYQMLAGTPPFTGDMMTIIGQHTGAPPPPLREQNHKLPKRAERVVMSALAKDPAERPQTAAAFANSLRANVDGLGALYRRAFALYSEYFPKFLRLSLIAHTPLILLALMMLTLQLLDKRLPKVLFIIGIAVVGLLQIAANFLTASVISGVTAIIVTQLTVAPLRPVELRTAFAVFRRRLRPFLRTSIRISLRIIVGFILFVIPGLVMTTRYLLYSPVVLMEGLERKAALQRARALAARSWRTVIFVTLIQFLVPMAVGALMGRLSVAGHRSSADPRVKITTNLSSLINIFILPLMSIVPALLYLKMRQLGGETLNEVLAQMEEVEPVRSRWQQRMRTRLTINTPHNRT